MLGQKKNKNTQQGSKVPHTKKVLHEICGGALEIACFPMSSYCRLVLVVKFPAKAHMTQDSPNTWRGV